MMRKVFDAYRHSLGLKNSGSLHLVGWYFQSSLCNTHTQDFKFDLDFQPNKSNHDNIIKLILLIINVDHYKLEKIK